MIQVVPSLIADAGGAIKEGVKLPFPTVCFWAVADLVAVCFRPKAGSQTNVSEWVDLLALTTGAPNGTCRAYSLRQL